MFINRYLAAFARGHGGKITVTCFLQLILTLVAGLRTGIGSCIAFTGDIPIRNFSLSAWGFPPVS